MGMSRITRSNNRTPSRALSSALACMDVNRRNYEVPGSPSLKQPDEVVIVPLHKADSCCLG